MTLLPPENPKSVWPSDRFVIYNTKTLRILEGQPDEKRAFLACRSLNNHEAREGRDTAYNYCPKD